MFSLLLLSLAHFLSKRMVFECTKTENKNIIAWEWKGASEAGGCACKLYKIVRIGEKVTRLMMMRNDDDDDEGDDDDDDEVLELMLQLYGK